MPRRSKPPAVNQRKHPEAPSGSALRTCVRAEARAQSSYLCGVPRGAAGRRHPSSPGKAPDSPAALRTQRPAARRARHVGRPPGAMDGLTGQRHLSGQATQASRSLRSPNPARTGAQALLPSSPSRHREIGVSLSADKSQFPSVVDRPGTVRGRPKYREI